MSRERRLRYAKLNKQMPNYARYYWSDYDYEYLKNITVSIENKNYKKISYSDCIIMLDTETSKIKENTTYIDKNGDIKYNSVDNKVVIWTISLGFQNKPFVTLYGRKPSECALCVDLIRSKLKGNRVIFFVHYLSYDWTFLRQYFISKFGEPEHQLNTKSHYPVTIEFENGVMLRDTLILAQRGLDKWSTDLDVTHKKALGDWDYDKIRTQSCDISDAELGYAEFDTLAGIECIMKTMQGLNVNIAHLPLTSTGILRHEVVQLARKYSYKEEFNKLALDFTQYQKALKVYHGGYVHANRNFIDQLIEVLVGCFDFSSSYPYTMVALPYFPMTKFVPCDATVDLIIDTMETKAYMFRATILRPRIKPSVVMPYIQDSKLNFKQGEWLDNGRVLCADLVDIYWTEYDLAIFLEQYDYQEIIITECDVAYKDYLPRWFRELVYKKFENKTRYKGGDKVIYSIEKAKCNSAYGLTVQKPTKPEIIEDYETGEYGVSEIYDEETAYNKYLANRKSVLPYQWGIYVTALATYNLFTLGKCAGTWIYSDTDSVYGSDWNEDMVKAYNDKCKENVIKAGFGPVIHNGREYWLGIAEHNGLEDEYSQFKVMGAKRYAGVCMEDNEIHITVAGVPKKNGAKCLKSLDEFTQGFVFDGSVTGKQTHTYLYNDMYIDEFGDEVADSIDLTKCNYKLDAVKVYDMEEIFMESESIDLKGGFLYG